MLHKIQFDGSFFYADFIALIYSCIITKWEAGTKMIIHNSGQNTSENTVPAPGLENTDIVPP